MYYVEVLTKKSCYIWHLLGDLSQETKITINPDAILRIQSSKSMSDFLHFGKGGTQQAISLMTRSYSSNNNVEDPRSFYNKVPQLPAFALQG